MNRVTRFFDRWIDRHPVLAYLVVVLGGTWAAVAWVGFIYWLGSS